MSRWEQIKADIFASIDLEEPAQKLMLNTYVAEGKYRNERDKERRNVVENAIAGGAQVLFTRKQIAEARREMKVALSQRKQQSRSPFKK